MPRPSNQKAVSRAAQSGGGAAGAVSPTPRLFCSGIDLAIGDELAERDEACVHVGSAVVELDRVDRAEARADQLGDEDIVVIVERFGAILRPVDTKGAADAINDRGLVNDLRTLSRRQGGSIPRLARRTHVQKGKA